MVLKQESKSAVEVFREVLEKELSRASDYDEEEGGGNSEGTQIKVTTEKTSSRKGSKQEDLMQGSYKGVKKAATTENLEDESEDQGQFGRTATTGITAQKGKRRRGRKLSSSHDGAQTTNIDSCDNLAETLRGKSHNQVAHVLDKEGCKVGASAGLSRSARANVKEYLDAAEDGTASLAVTGASEDATEVSMVDGIPAPHAEIKAMVRDILFKDILQSCANSKEYLDAAEDGTASLVTGASEDATEVSMVDGIPAPHMKIKAMVRDILFKDIYDDTDGRSERYKGCTDGKGERTPRKKRQHKCPICKDYGHHWHTCKKGDPEDIAAMMAERGPPEKRKKISKSCTKKISKACATASVKGGKCIKQRGTGVGGESRKVTLRERKGKSTEDKTQVTKPETWNDTTKNINSKNGNGDPKKEVVDTAPVGQPSCPHSLLPNSSMFHQGSDALTKELDRRRQIWSMQGRGLIPPPGECPHQSPAPILRKKNFVPANKC